MGESTLIVVAAVGLLAGVVHALSGPDHLAAVAPLAIGQRGRRLGGWGTGFLWGVGHSLGVWAVGLLALALRGVLPVERLSSWSERLVGATLVAVGLWGLRKAFADRLPARWPDWLRRPHRHEAAGDAPARRGPGRAAFGIGALHGLAGSSHLLGIFPALALPSLSASLAYVGAFGLGTIGAMAAFSSLLGGFAGRLPARGAFGYQALLGGLSAAAVVVGGVWLIP